MRHPIRLLTPLRASNYRLLETVDLAAPPPSVWIPSSAGLHHPWASAFSRAISTASTNLAYAFLADFVAGSHHALFHHRHSCWHSLHNIIPAIVVDCTTLSIDSPLTITFGNIYAWTSMRCKHHSRHQCIISLGHPSRRLFSVLSFPLLTP